uniref:Uncharacterized protein n=1 Tax=Wuchereria bancrofti TaxID=6293 RepID=A0AAF5PS01_WUCBA
MTNKKQFDRSINMLFPMKIDGSEDIEDKTEDRSDEPITCRTRSIKDYKLQINPTLVARLMLQRNDVIIKRSLLLSPCKSKELTIENMEFNEGLINKMNLFGKKSLNKEKNWQNLKA